MTKQETVSDVLMLAAGATIVIGFVALLFPKWLVHLFDGQDISNFHFVRYIGTALIGFGVMNWWYSRFDMLGAVLPAIYGNLVSLAIAMIVDIAGMASGELARRGTIILAVHTLFAGLFTYCAWLIHTHKDDTTPA